MVKVVQAVETVVAKEVVNIVAEKEEITTVVAEREEVVEIAVVVTVVAVDSLT
jgi:hypothetical protein